MDIKKAYLFLIEVGTNLSLSRFLCFTTVDLLHDFVVAFDHSVTSQNAWRHLGCLDDRGLKVSK